MHTQLTLISRCAPNRDPVETQPTHMSRREPNRHSCRVTSSLSQPRRVPVSGCYHILVHVPAGPCPCLRMLPHIRIGPNRAASPSRTHTTPTSRHTPNPHVTYTHVTPHRYDAHMSRHTPNKHSCRTTHPSHKVLLVAGLGTRDGSFTITHERRGARWKGVDEN